MTQLYAKIKKSSKYFDQNAAAIKNGEFPFRVSIKPDCGGYHLIGGPGGTYRMSDVNLFVKVGSVFVKIGGR